MNGVWDSGETHALDPGTDPTMFVTQARVFAIDSTGEWGWTLEAKVRDSGYRVGVVGSWDQDARLPDIFERVCDTEEQARDECIAFLMRRRMGGA